MSQRVTQAELAADVIDGLDDPTPGAVERATAEFPARSVASAAAASAAGGGGNGGSSPIEVVRVPVAFDTPDLDSAGAFPIIDAGADSFTVAGDHVAVFNDPGRSFNTDLSGYTIVSAALTGGNTVITLTGPPAGGDTVILVDWVRLGGIAIREMAAGDVLLSAIWAVTDAWDGTQPAGRLLLGDNNPAATYIYGSDNWELDSPPPLYGLWRRATDAVVTQIMGLQATLVVSEPATLYAQVYTTTNSVAAPGSSQGAGEIVLLVLKAS